MSERRITKAERAARLARLNRMLGQKVEAYTVHPDGTHRWNVGTYILDAAFGGLLLSRITGPTGGEGMSLTRRGTKREAYRAMGAFIEGIHAAREVKA
jgi:hypothetical protein